MLQVNDPVKVVKECSSTRVMRHTRMMVRLEKRAPEGVFSTHAETVGRVADARVNNFDRTR